MGFSFQLIHFSLYVISPRSLFTKIIHGSHSFTSAIRNILDCLHSIATIRYVTPTLSHLQWIYQPCFIDFYCLAIHRDSFSSKLLGFICELVESSQTVQQHMIQVNYLLKKQANTHSAVC